MWNEFAPELRWRGRGFAQTLSKGEHPATAREQRRKDCGELRRIHGSTPAKLMRDLICTLITSDRFVIVLDTDIIEIEHAEVVVQHDRTYFVDEGLRAQECFYGVSAKGYKSGSQRPYRWGET